MMKGMAKMVCLYTAMIGASTVIADLVVRFPGQEWYRFGGWIAISCIILFLAVDKV